MSKLVELYLPSQVILPVKSAAKIIELLEGSHTLTDSWNDDKITASKDITYTVTAFPETKFNNICKAQVLGMTYKEYLDAQRIAAERVQEDKTVPPIE